MNLNFSVSNGVSYAKEPPLDDLVKAVLAGGGKTLETSETLPPATYTSQAFFDLEVEKIFTKDWICVGHVSQVPNVGDYFTVDLFNELLVVVRGKDRIRVLSRVCLHRWAPVASGSGNTKVFSCPFHRWAYALDGQLIATPFMEKAKELDPRDCRLPEIRNEIIEELGLIFVTLSPEVDSIRERIGDLVEILRPYELKELVAVRPSPREAAFNWKIYIETGQECYHHFGAHQETFERMYPSRLSWCGDGTADWTVCHSPIRKDAPDEAASIGLPIFPKLTGESRRSLNIYHIFPLSRLISFPDRVLLRMVYPIGPLRTKAMDVWLVRPEAAATPNLVDEKFDQYALFADKAGKEDNDMDERQQRGAASSFARVGRFSHLEACLWHMGEYIRRRIAADRSILAPLEPAKEGVSNGPAAGDRR